MRTLLLTGLALTFSATALAQRPGFALSWATSTDVYRYADTWQYHDSNQHLHFRLRNSVGVQAHYVTAHRVAFTGGVLLSDKGPYFDGAYYAPLAGSTLARYTVNQHRMFLDVPIKLGYGFRLTDHLSLTPTSGAILSEEIYSSTVVTESNGARKTYQGSVSSGSRLTIPLELHLDWLLTERIALSAAPYYRFDVNLGVDEARSYGLLLDLRYFLK